MKLPDDYEAQLPSNYDLVIGFLQVFDLLLNISQTSNDELMKELQHQNSDYLEKFLHNLNIITTDVDTIIKQNKTIIEQNKEILMRMSGE